MLENRQFIWDKLLEMKDSYAVTASALASVDGVAKQYNTGGAFTRGVLVVDVTAIGGGAASSNRYTIVLQASDTTTFTNYVGLARVVLGQPIASLIEGLGTNITPSTGRYIVPFINMVNDTIYQHLRVYTYAAGTSSKTVTFSAFLSVDKN